MPSLSIRRFGFALILFGCARGILEAGTVQVVAEHVNLRAGPGSDCEVVAQATTGDTLETSDRRQGDWLEVVPPVGTVLWVYAELVQDDVSAVDDLRVRGGPGINYRAVGKLGKGAKVTVQGRDGDWLRIAPPADTRLWVNTQFVRSKNNDVEATFPIVGANPLLKTQRADIPAPQEATGATTTLPPRAVGPEPGARENSGGKGTAIWAPPPGSIGVPVRCVGALRRTGVSVWRRPSHYRLIGKDTLGRDVTRCYVVAPKADLEHYAERDIELVGQEYAVQGVRYPVVVSEAISAR